MIGRIKLTYEAGEAVKKLTDADYARCHAAMPEMFSEKRSDYFGYHETVVDLQTDGRLLSSLGIPFEIKQLKGTMPIGEVIPALGGPIHVHVPNIGLLAMDEVRLLEDACTDAVQDALNEGWRILCVCPPNSARRPDYIFGRVTPEGEKSKPHSARR